jgi:hypothetical protein
MSTAWLFTDEQHAHSIAGHTVVAWIQGFPILRLSPEPHDEKAAWIEVVQPVLPSSGAIRDDGQRFAAYAVIRSLLAELAALMHYGFGAAPPRAEIKRW